MVSAVCQGMVAQQEDQYHDTGRHPDIHDRPGERHRRGRRGREAEDRQIRGDGRGDDARQDGCGDRRHHDCDALEQDPAQADRLTP
ncbi:hypothetical protein [Streptomyces sp. NPDC058751]|uniref:hypothetical protein n=1 Tax=Streptomyces sp. NPDC058751 TaxID=3346623 RepID=UPI0036914F74